MKHRITRYLLTAVMAVAACTVSSCDEEVVIEDYDPVITFTPSTIKFTNNEAVDFPYVDSNKYRYAYSRYIHIEAPDWVEFSSSYNTGFISAEEWNQNGYNRYESYWLPRAIRCIDNTPGLSGTVKVTYVYPLIDGKELRWYGEFTVER